MDVLIDMSLPPIVAFNQFFRFAEGHRLTIHANLVNEDLMKLEIQYTNPLEHMAFAVVDLKGVQHTIHPGDHMTAELQLNFEKFQWTGAK